MRGPCQPWALVPFLFQFPALRASARSSGVVASSATGPLLREAFGGSTGLVDLVDRKARDQASYPDEDPSLALSKVTGAASRTTVLNDHGKHNPKSDVEGGRGSVVDACAEPAGNHRRM
jgi:hypothetical protein